MTTYSLSHLPDAALLNDLLVLVRRDRATTAALLAHLAEVDARKLYLPAAYPSMHAYCVGVLRLSEDAAYKRIRVARTALRFPAIFAAIEDGRLHLSAVILLTPFLSEGTVDELIEVASHKRRDEIERLLAERFPRLDVPEQIKPLSEDAAACQLAPGPVGMTQAEHSPVPTPAAPRDRIEPVAPERFAWQLTVGRSANDKLRYVRELLGHKVPSGDLAAVLERALDALIREEEKSKFAACERPRPSRAPRRDHRDVPAEVKREVWRRDGGQCTFVDPKGRRCASRTRLEFDHVEAFARGGESSVTNLRLRCRAHNQFEADRTFGRAFMESQRTRRDAEPAATTDAERDVTPWLRRLGFRADEARRAAAHVRGLPDSSLEERMRRALCFLTPAHRRPRAAAATG